MRQIRRAAALLLALLLVLTMAGCGSEKTLTLTAAMPEVPATLDPAMVTTDTEKTVVLHLYENLMKLSSGGSRAVAGQASSYEKTDNGDGTETYTFRLRSALTWSDGTPLTAADFVYAWQRLADPATGSPNASLLRMVAGYDRVRAGEGAENLAVSAPDERTFVVTLSGHCPYFAESVCVAPETMPARADAVQSVLPVTNGAYEVSSWEDGQLTAVQRRAYYDSRRLGAQSLTFLFETDADARQQLFEDGKADFLLGLTEQAVERRSDSWSAEPGFRVAALLVNQLAEATGEEPLRQALSLSIDRNALTDAIGARTHLSAQGLVPTGVRNTAGEEFRTATGPVIDNLPEHREQNLRQAAKLLEGVADGGAIELLYEQTDENETVMHQLKQTWQDGLSLTVTLRGVSADELQQSLQRRRSHRGRRDAEGRIQRPDRLPRDAGPAARRATGATSTPAPMTRSCAWYTHRVTIPRVTRTSRTRRRCCLKRATSSRSMSIRGRGSCATTSRGSPPTTWAATGWAASSA